SRELENQLRDTTKHFEEKIAGSFCLQRQLADEKLRAVACKACAHTARDIVSGEELRRSEELATQLRRRRLDLRRTCASYVRQERLRMEAIAGMESSRQAAKVERAWREAQEVLQRALPLCKGEDSNAQPLVTALAEQPAQPLEELLNLPAPEDAAAFFAEAGASQTCIDCKLPDADWASVSVGAYLCVDCA
ncbi:hcpC, partial [Symbiodinium sp. CCMP2592]